jgi:hypothetical protein
MISQYLLTLRRHFMSWSDKYEATCNAISGGRIWRCREDEEAIIDTSDQRLLQKSGNSHDFIYEKDACTVR